MVIIPNTICIIGAVLTFRALSPLLFITDFAEVPFSFAVVPPFEVALG